jgi:hypothetical protein
VREPRKATYLRFEASPELEFEHYLTEKLGLGTVEDMRRRMSQAEFLRWSIYYQRKAQRQQLEMRRAA